MHQCTQHCALKKKKIPLHIQQHFFSKTNKQQQHFVFSCGRRTDEKYRPIRSKVLIKLIIYTRKLKKTNKFFFFANEKYGDAKKIDEFALDTWYMLMDLIIKANVVDLFRWMWEEKNRNRILYGWIIFSQFCFAHRAAACERVCMGEYFFPNYALHFAW